MVSEAAGFTHARNHIIRIRLPHVGTCQPQRIASTELTGPQRAWVNAAVRQGKPNRRRNAPQRATINRPATHSRNHPPYDLIRHSSLLIPQCRRRTSNAQPIAHSSISHVPGSGTAVSIRLPALTSHVPHQPLWSSIMNRPSKSAPKANGSAL